MNLKSQFYLYLKTEYYLDIVHLHLENHLKIRSVFKLINEPKSSMRLSHCQ